MQELVASFRDQCRTRHTIWVVLVQTQFVAIFGSKQKIKKKIGNAGTLQRPTKGEIRGKKFLVFFVFKKGEKNKNRKNR